MNPFSTVPNPAYTRVQAGAAFGGRIKKDKTYFYFSYEITRRHETGFASIGQDNFGLLNNVDLSNAFGLPAGTIQQGVSATALQRQFFQQLPAAEAALATVSPALAAGYGKEAALYATFVGGSSGIALNGSYPLIFGALAGTAIPIPPNGSSPLTQFPTSCNAAGNVLCNSLPANFLSLNSQVGNFPVFEGTSLYSLRLDHNVSNNNRLTLRANVSPSTITGIEVNGENQVFGQNAYSRTSQQTYRDVSGVFQDTWTIGNNKVNEFRFQYAPGAAWHTSTTLRSPPAAAMSPKTFPASPLGRKPCSYVQACRATLPVHRQFLLDHWPPQHKDSGGDFNYLSVDATFTVDYSGLYDSARPTHPVWVSAIFAPLTVFPRSFARPCRVHGCAELGLGLPEMNCIYGSPADSFSECKP